MHKRIKELAIRANLLVPPKDKELTLGETEFWNTLRKATDAKLQFYYEMTGGKPAPLEDRLQKFADLVIQDYKNNHA